LISRAPVACAFAYKAGPPFRTCGAVGVLFGFDAAGPTILPSANVLGVDVKTLSSTDGRSIMLHYAVVFFVIALIAAFFGFSGVAVGAAGVAKTFFVIFLILALASFVVNLVRGRK
jgi:uncharacterized membrane protein YtjA (UPF0391 family)